MIFLKLTIYGGHNDVTFHLTDRVLHEATVIPNVFFGHWSNMKSVVLGRKGVGGAGMDRSPIFKPLVNQPGAPFHEACQGHIPHILHSPRGRLSLHHRFCDRVCNIKRERNDFATTELRRKSMRSLK